MVADNQNVPPPPTQNEDLDFVKTIQRNVQFVINTNQYQLLKYINEMLSTYIALQKDK